LRRKNTKNLFVCGKEIEIHFYKKFQNSKSYKYSTDKKAKSQKPGFLHKMILKNSF